MHNYSHIYARSANWGVMDCQLYRYCILKLYPLWRGVFVQSQAPLAQTAFRALSRAVTWPISTVKGKSRKTDTAWSIHRVENGPESAKPP